MTDLNRCFYAVVLASLGAGAITVAADGAAAQSGATPTAATAEILPHSESVLGKTLVDASGERAGRIVDVLADKTGQVKAAIVDYGGFLGIGSRRVAVAWQELRFGTPGNPNAVAVGIPLDRLARAPQVKTGQPVTVIGAPRVSWHRAARK